MCNLAVSYVQCFYDAFILTRCRLFVKVSANTESFRGRVFRSSRQPSAKLHVPMERPPRYKQWGEEQLGNAFKEVKEGGLLVSTTCC